MSPLPTSDNAWIADLLDALRRRSRALKHKTHSVACEKVLEEANGERTERMDISLKKSGSSQGFVLRAKVWDDRWAWIDARAGGKNGWTFEWTIAGRAAGGLSGRAFMQAIETTFDAISSAGAVDNAALATMWAPLLLNGPKPV